MKINYPLLLRMNLFGHPANGFRAATWFRSLFRYGFHWFELPKVLIISLITILSWPIAVVEKWRISASVNKTKIKAPVFIVGHPRSGTTMLHYLLAADERFITPKTVQAVLPATYLSLSFFLRPLMRFMMPASRPMDDMSLGPDEPKEEEFALAALSGSFGQAYYFPNFIEKIFREYVLFDSASRKKNWQRDLKSYAVKLMCGDANRTLLLKSPYNLARISEILEVFPDARFIHIHRKPEEVYRSNLRLYQKLLPVTALQKPDGERIEHFINESFAIVYEKFNREKTLPENQLIEVSFESVTADPVKVLEKIYRQLELPTFYAESAALQELVAVMKDYRPNTYDHEINLPDSWRTAQF